MLASCFVVPLLSGLGPWWFGWVWSHLLLPNPEWSPLLSPQTHTHSNSDDDTPFQQLGSRPYEMGQCTSLFISRNIQFLCALFYIFLPIPKLLVCAINSHQLVKIEIAVIWNGLFMYKRLLLLHMNRVHIVEIVNVMNGSQMKLRCEFFHFWQLYFCFDILFAFLGWVAGLRDLVVEHGPHAS